MSVLVVNNLNERKQPAVEILVFLVVTPYSLVGVYHGVIIKRTTM
jgi:hypothetical protein